MGYFGIGAFSGALSAGIATGIGGVMNISKMSFGKAFFASSSILSSLKGGFISGLASGAGAGFAGGLISGTGNGLLDGNNIGSSLGKGFVDGLIGGASGGIIGGLAEGIAALADERDFLYGGFIKDEIYDRNLPFVRQKGKMNCTAAVAESVSQGKVTQDGVRALTVKGNPDVDVIIDSDAMRIAAKATGRTINNIDKSIKDVNVVMQRIKDNSDIIYNLGVADPGHAVAINKVIFRTITKPNKVNIYKTLIYIMDPAAGQYIRIPKSTLNTYINRLIIK